MQEKATFAGGCFWCTEAIFTRLKGVTSVIPGYSGGTKENPTYEEVCTGTTNHAESIQITFDPSVISYKQLLEVFFHLHDPTTRNQQGNDLGTQYRSAIFYHNGRQREETMKVIEELTDAKTYRGNIVTEVTSYKNFYPAEDYHRDYYSKNSYQPYCQYVIDPKIQKLLHDYGKQMKDEFRTIE